MSSFQIHRDTNEKENPSKTMPLKEKTNVLGLKQPLAVIGGKEKATRANFAELNTNIGHGPAGKAVLGEVGNRKTITVDYDAKKSNVVPVVEQFKNFFVYEDNSETQTALQPRRVKCLPEKENLGGGVRYDSMHQYDLDATPMSVTDVLSPMSVDRSLIDISNTSLMSDQPLDSNGQVIVDLKDAAKAVDNELLPKEQPPRNDRERFFDVVQYQFDILQNFRESEKKHRPKPQYMRRQNDINQSMRTILVDWLVEVSEEYNMDTETLYLSVSYIDRFLSLMSVVRSKLQLVGTAAMYIASKYEEIYPPDVSEFVFITDDTYTKGQVLRMEQIILKILSFDLCTPTAHVFVNTYAALCDMPDKLKFLTLYICELSLMDADPFLQYLPSLISAAALALSRHILGLEIWNPELEDITTYKLDSLKEVFLHLCKIHNAVKDLSTQAIREKYNRDKYKKVSAIEAIELDEASFNGLLQAYNYKAGVSNGQKQPDMGSKSKVNLFYKF